MKKQNRSILLISCIALVSGVVFYGIYNEIIIIRLPVKNVSSVIDKTASSRKKLSFFFWHKNTEMKEEKEIIYSTNPQICLFNIVAGWLSLAEEEELLKKKVSLQTVMLDSSGKDAFVSFDRSLFSKNDSIFSKFMTIESLLKTISASGVPVKQVHILVNYKPLQDQHIDFSHPWPLSGYIVK
jgi:hypothetical protein